MRPEPHPAGAFVMPEAVSAMACVSVIYRFADGDVLQVSVEPDDGYPDALDQARAVVVRGFGEALGLSMEALTKGDES